MAIVPPEIQAFVVEWVYRLSQHRLKIDYNTILACALVCRAWRPIAQRLLFRRVTPGVRVKRLLRTLRACPHLAAHVRSLHLTLTQADAVDATLLEVCPNVAGLHMEVGAQYTQFTDMRQLAIPQHITSVTLSGSPYDVDAVLQLWPGLPALEIDDVLVYEDAPDDPPLVRIPSAVSSLSLHPYVITQILATDRDLPALHDLEFNEPHWSSTEWPPILRASGLLPKLRTLVLTGPLPPNDILEQLEQLDSLVINALPDGAVSLPKSLRHIGYHHHIDVWTYSPNDASFLLAALRALRRLELVTVTRKKLPVETLAEIGDVCRELDVELVTFETPEHFPLSVL
ncbi:hypothetical protein FA95DRAFT_1277381 [Auriscalpium vulgare]|uniref:Uncharacterized protein n=1 Tax=Auriscalpium vulgare TaxID=40419 RepID=A0ACB8R3N7_9AGAM|nr:hypothetical protein FA95DRAFT_1277381 [Auriscalpium vulgare]